MYKCLNLLPLFSSSSVVYSMRSCMYVCCVNLTIITFETVNDKQHQNVNRIDIYQLMLEKIHKLYSNYIRSWKSSNCSGNIHTYMYCRWNDTNRNTDIL